MSHETGGSWSPVKVMSNAFIVWACLGVLMYQCVQMLRRVSGHYMLVFMGFMRVFCPQAFMLKASIISLFQEIKAVVIVPTIVKSDTKEGQRSMPL